MKKNYFTMLMTGLGIMTMGILSSCNGQTVPHSAEKTSKAKVVCFGDSITKRGYYEILGNWLGIEAVNAGVAGNSTAQALRRMEKDVLAERPDVAVIFFGTNDLRVDAPKVFVPVKDYAANLEKMISACRQQQIRVVLCTLPPINQKIYFTRHPQTVYDDAGGLPQLIADYRSAAIQTAQKLDVPLVDLNSLLENEPHWMTSDGVHPSPQGNAIIARHIIKAVKPLLKTRIKDVAPTTDGNAIQADIVVYGATSSGVIAAVQAARMNKSVVLLESSEHLGGLTSGGLGATDIGNKGVIGGLSREFYHRVALYYSQKNVWTREDPKAYFENRSTRTKLDEILRPDGTMWTFEPHVARKIYIDMLNEVGITVRYNEPLHTVKKEGARITSISTGSGYTYRAKVFIDASYEGDLMAMAAVSYRIGREANSLYNETLNGIRASTPKNQIYGSIDPYVIPGNPSSGLIPLIQPGDGGTPGAGDHRVQAYNIRLCFTNIAENRLAIVPPANYDPKRYELAVRRVESIVNAGVEPQMSKFCTLRWMPNGKTDINNGGGISTDFIGMNYDYPDGNFETRADIYQAHKDYIQGFWYFMSHNERIPENLRKQFQAFGPCKDEFINNGGWSRQMYVREARRMVSAYVMTEHNCRGKTVAKDSIGMAAYGMDSHNCQRIVQNGAARNEGDVQDHNLKPYPISYRSIVPTATECENLIVPVCLSATHIAFGSIRMEPVFMVLGHSAADAAVQAINDGVIVQDVDYDKLRSLLWVDNQVLTRQ